MLSCSFPAAVCICPPASRKGRPRVLYVWLAPRLRTTPTVHELPRLDRTQGDAPPEWEGTTVSRFRPCIARLSPQPRGRTTAARLSPHLLQMPSAGRPPQAKRRAEVPQQRKEGAGRPQEKRVRARSNISEERNSQVRV